MDGQRSRAPEPTNAGAQIEALVTRLPVVLFELDREGRYTLSMGSALANIGRQPGQVVGSSIFDLYPNLPHVHDAVRSALRGNEASRTVEVHGRVFEAVYLPKRGAAGGVEGVIGIACDVTDLHLKTRALEASERRLRESEARFRSLVTNMRDIIFCHGTQGDGSYGYDGGGAALYGVDAQKLAGTVDEQGRARIATWYDAVHPEDRPAYLAAERRRKERHQGYALEYRITHPTTGELRWMREVAWVVREEALRRTHFDSYILDITEQKNTEIALRESRERYRRLLEAAPVAILIYADGLCTYANPRAVRLLGGRRAEDVLGRHVLGLTDAREAERFRVELENLVDASGHMRPRELPCVRLDGSPILVEASAVAVAEQGAPAVQLVLVDLAERKRAEALHHLAQHDSLTGLPNRLLLMERLGQAVAAARRRGGDGLALMLLDLDGFKEVNDTFGHAAGDELLRRVAARVRKTVREVDTLARLGGDEFALLQTQAHGADAMALVASRIVDAVAEPFRIDHHEVRTTASIGIASCPRSGATADALLRQADLALYQAKQQGRSRFCFYEPSLNAAVEARRRLEVDLNRACERGELHLVYQPQLDMATRRVVGVEALLRWHSPARGPVNPNEFIPVAEATGLIRSLGAWVLDEACARARAWAQEGLGLRMAVNVSAVQLRRPDFADLVAAALHRNVLPPEHLCLELTESLLIDPQLDGIGSTLGDVATTGVAIAIDDFGTGYSSLLNLKRLPVQHVKIDRSFIREVGNDADSEAIVRATVSLAHSLGKRVVAEGVETEAQHGFLAALGCDQAQGFVYARPGRADSIRPYLSAHA